MKFELHCGRKNIAEAFTSSVCNDVRNAVMRVSNDVCFYFNSLDSWIGKSMAPVFASFVPVFGRMTQSQR